MKKLFLLSFAILLALSSSCGSKKTILIDDRSSFEVHQNADGQPVIVGQIKWSEWKDNADWDSYSASEYTPDSEKANKIKHFAQGQNASFLIFAASWCEDCESELPKIMKLIIEAEIDPQKVTIFGLDENKKEPRGIADNYRVKRIPTLVVNAGPKELGRIVEYPEGSWEDNIIKILKA